MENKVVEKRNCFAYQPGYCRALTEKLCKTRKCPFFKTRKQFVDDIIKYTSNIEEREYYIKKYRK